MDLELALVIITGVYALLTLWLGFSAQRSAKHAKYAAEASREAVALQESLAVVRLTISPHYTVHGLEEGAPGPDSEYHFAGVMLGSEAGSPYVHSLTITEHSEPHPNGSFTVHPVQIPLSPRGVTLPTRIHPGDMWPFDMDKEATDPGGPFHLFCQAVISFDGKNTRTITVRDEEAKGIASGSGSS